MRRREFVAGVGSSAAWPLLARAQQPAMPVVGYLYAGKPETDPRLVAAFRKGMSETGFVEGQNVAVEYRWGQNEFERLAELAADLVRRQVTVIATPNSIAAALAVKSATGTIPIVFSTAGDPVQVGLVASLNRPGGNVTGATSMQQELGGKRLSLLHEVVPKAAHFGLLINPESPFARSTIEEAQSAASAIRGQIEPIYAARISEIDTAFAKLVENGVDALMVASERLFVDRRVQIVTLAARHGLPAIYDQPDFVEVGGLMSYGSSTPDLFRQTGIYTGRILKGEKPTELPVMRATKFEIVINLQTARTFGLTVPPTLVAIADEVIE
jgi:putative ABC transport system substrate-binding protein